MKKVLVSGSAGFIGSNMVKFLLDNSDYKIIGVDNFSGGVNNKKFIENLEKENPERFSFINDNYTNVDVSGIDIVYHFAAIPSVSYSVENPIETNNSNVTNTLKFIQNCNNGGVKRFVFSSSSAVYGDVNSFPTTELYNKVPKSPYALQKSIIEEYCRLWSELYDLDTVSLRYFNDICNANFIIGNYSGKLNGRCFNAAGGNNYSLNKIKGVIETLSKNRSKVINKPSRVGDVLKTHSDSSSLGKYGFKTKVSLENGIKKTYNWYNNII